MTQHICPRCLQQISEERANQRPCVCNNCGMVQSPAERLTNDNLEKASLQALIGIAVFVLLGYTQAINWGEYSIEVIPVQLSRVFGMASPSQYARLSEMCMDLKKYDCVELSYETLGRTDRAYLGKLGHFLMSRQKYTEAAAAFKSYLATRTGDLDATYAYAKALGEIGQINDAVKQFEIVLAAKPDVLQRTVLTRYVDFLVRHQELKRAAEVIERARRRSPAAVTFMDRELQLIKSRLAQG